MKFSRSLLMCVLALGYSISATETTSNIPPSGAGINAETLTDSSPESIVSTTVDDSEDAVAQRNLGHHHHDHHHDHHHHHHRDEYHPGVFRRETVEAHWTLEGIDTDTPLTDGETVFFEHALRKAVMLTQKQQTNSDDNEEEELQLGAVLVENGHGEHKDHDGRSLRGVDNTRRTTAFSPFNIWAILEASFRCRFCGDHRSNDDDDYSRTRSRWSLFHYYKSNRTPWYARRYYDDDDISDIGSMYGGRYGGRRMLGKSDEKDRLEETLCELLREGPMERFQSVTECSLEVLDW